MIKKVLRMLIRALFLISAFVLLVWGYLSYVSNPPKLADVDYGITFSRKQTNNFGYKWQDVYLAILDDLEIKNLRISAYWDLIEPEKGSYNFADFDWMVDEASQRGVNITLAMGRKLPRWPECHDPFWSSDLEESEKQERILNLDKAVVERYKDNKTVVMWQVENEPFLPFGVCPEITKDFLRKEVDLVASLDSRPILVTDSGELSTGFKTAQYGNVFGTTLYRVVYNKYLKYWHYPIPSSFYYEKARILKYLTGIDEFIIAELQAEPWGFVSNLTAVPLEEQMKSMDFEQFKSSLGYARDTGIKKQFLWGAEWWYWMKEAQNNDKYWNYVKNLIKNNTQM